MTLKTPPSDFFYCLFWGWRQAGPAVVSRWWCPCPWFSPRGHLLSLYMFIFPHAGPWAHVQELQQGLGADLVLGGCLTGRSLPRTWQKEYLFLRSHEISTDGFHLQIGFHLHTGFGHFMWFILTSAPKENHMSRVRSILNVTLCVFCVVCVFLKPCWGRMYSPLDFLGLGS